MDEGVEVVRSPSAGGLSILTNKQENETVPSIEEDAFGQEATLVECCDNNSPTNKTMFGSIYKSLRRKKVKHRFTKYHSSTAARQCSVEFKIGSGRAAARSQSKGSLRAPTLGSSLFVENNDVKQEFPAEFKGMTRIDMIETAFKYAVEARRLVSSNQNYNALNDALEDHRAQGEAAALEAHHFILACKSRANLDLDVLKEQNETSMNGLYTPQDIQDAAETHRTSSHFSHGVYSLHL